MNTGSFPVVGDSVLSYVGSGGAAKKSKYTTAVPKSTMGRGSSPTGTTGSRSNTKIQEAQGPKCHIVSKLYESNAAESSATQRNVRVMPSAAGVSDFWKKRQFGQRY